MFTYAWMVQHCSDERQHALGAQLENGFAALKCLYPSWCLAKLIQNNLKHRVGQNRMYTLYMTVYFMKSVPKIPYIHRIYMVLANPTHTPQLARGHMLLLKMNK